MKPVINMSNKNEHLNMIQGVINRLANNSLQLKCWTIAITTAFIALANGWVISIALIPIAIFCIMDAKYLSTERSFRGLFNNVRKREESEIDYSMNFKPFEEKITKSIFSWSVAPFYIVLAITVIIVTILRAVN